MYIPVFRRVLCAHVRLVLVLGACALLCGCGQTGPLYLPEKKASESSQPADDKPETQPEVSENE